MLKPKSRKHVPSITESLVKEIVDDTLRAALREHARNLEKHLKDIHERLIKLEAQVGPR